MARRQDHLRQVGRVPGAEDEAAVVGVGAEGVDDAGQLVDALAGVVGLGVDVGGAKVAPLEAVDGPEVAGLAVRQAEVVEELARAVAVPDLDALRGEGLGGGVARDEPEELGNDGLGEDALCGEEGEDGRAVAVERELERARGEDGVGACAGAGGWLSAGGCRWRGTERSGTHRSRRSSPWSRISRTKSRYWYSSWRAVAVGGGAAASGSFSGTVIFEAYLLAIGAQCVFFDGNWDVWDVEEGWVDVETRRIEALNASREERRDRAR